MIGSISSRNAREEDRVVGGYVVRDQGQGDRTTIICDRGEDGVQIMLGWHQMCTERAYVAAAVAVRCSE